MAKPKKNKNGKWTVRVYDYTDENGKLLYHGGKSKWQVVTKKNKRRRIKGL